MNNCKKTIKQSDITTTPIKLKYAATYSRTDTDIISVNGVSYPFFPNTNILWHYAGDIPSGSIAFVGNTVTATNGRNYKLIKQLYYQNYITGSLSNSASYWDWNQQSTACSGSSEYEYRYLTTGSVITNGGNSAVFAYIPPNYYGEQISRGSFCFQPQTGNAYKIIDDGNGNLIDTVNNNQHIGNIIYSHGMIIITNNNYLSTFSDA